MYRSLAYSYEITVPLRHGIKRNTEKTLAINDPTFILIIVKGTYFLMYPECSFTKPDTPISENKTTRNTKSTLLLPSKKNHHQVTNTS